MLGYLLRGLILGATAAAQPGPLQAYLLSLITRVGRQRALPAALAPLISDGPILLLVLLILVRVPTWLLSGLQLAGGLYLLYLAWGAWRNFRRNTMNSNDNEAESTQTNILKAALMNFLSPAPYIFWATIAGPILLEGWRQAPVIGLAFLAGFYIALVGGLMIFIVIFAAAGEVDPRVNRALGAFSAIALMAFGLYQLAAGLSGVGAVMASGQQ